VFLDPQNAPKSLAAGTSPQTPLGELTAPPDPLAGLRGPTSKGPTSKRKQSDAEFAGNRLLRMFIIDIYSN